MIKPKREPSNPDAPQGIWRRPAGYVGQNHEIMGHTFVAITQILKLPEQVLGAETVRVLAGIQAESWYPIATFLELLGQLEAGGGTAGLVQVGRRLIKNSMERAAKEGRGKPRSARAVLGSLDESYHRTNRGTNIGGWKVTVFEPGRAELENNTIHHCAMEEGIVSEALRSIGASPHVTQTECFRKGDRLCRFVITSPLTDARWTG